MSQAMFVIQCPHCMRAMGILASAKKKHSCLFCHGVFDPNEQAKVESDSAGVKSLVAKMNAKLGKEARNYDKDKNSKVQEIKSQEDV